MNPPPETLFLTPGNALFDTTKLLKRRDFMFSVDFQLFLMTFVDFQRDTNESHQMNRDTTNES